MVYLKIGYTKARLDVQYEDGTALTTPDFNVRDDLEGARIGLGAELAISGSAYAKVELRYSGYESDFDKKQALVGFGFRF